MIMQRSLSTSPWQALAARDQTIVLALKQMKTSHFQQRVTELRQ